MKIKRRMKPNMDRSERGARFLEHARANKASDEIIVSIVTVVRNGEKHIEQTIQSVLSQSYNYIEYIIIDGASTDGTLDVIRKYQHKIDYWISEPDNGIYDAMNKGIEASTGILINLLNADDFLETTAVEDIVEEFKRANRPDILYGNAYYLDERFAIKTAFYSFRRPTIGMTINHQSMFVQRAVYESIGLYDDSYKYAGDYDFVVRCEECLVRFHKVNRFLVTCRNDGASILWARLSRREGELIARQHFGSYSIRRIYHFIYNQIWVPVKLGLRPFLYNSIGTKASRTIVALLERYRH